MILPSLLLVFAPQQPTTLTVLARGQEHRVEVQLAGDGRPWIGVDSLAALSGFELRPEGLCSGELCVPWPGEDGRRIAEDQPQIELDAVLERLGVAVAKTEVGDVWSLAPAPLLRAAGLESGIAPDLELRDRKGEPWRLSSLRGHKVVLVTWASW